MPRFGGMPFMPKPGAPKGERFELTDEQKAEMQELLLQDLENGKITQEQYDAILNGEMPKFGGVPFMPNPECFKGEKPERPELTDGQRPEPEERFAQDFDFPQGMIPPGGKMGNKPVPPGNMKR
ncbi:MAG: hypothetical protein FWD58_09135 [Firmicutes bacterium]|nr:hypothetical protein [Bacillota bacterium]